MDIQLAEQLQKYANEAIDKAREVSHTFDEAINWGHLSCTDVEYIQSLHGGNYYRIIVEEAAYGCIKLQNYIAEYILNQNISTFFQVETEW